LIDAKSGFRICFFWLSIVECYQKKIIIGVKPQQSTVSMPNINVYYFLVLQQAKLHLKKGINIMSKILANNSIK
jgi:hypothetical protein